MAHWGSVSVVAVAGQARHANRVGGLLDIMSEQLAQSFDQPPPSPNAKDLPVEESHQLSAEEEFDLALALQLQEEEDGLAAAHVQSQQKHGPKGNVTLRYHSSPILLPIARCTEGSDEEEEEPGTSPSKRASPPWPIRDKTLKGQGGEAEIITKHDTAISQLKNGASLDKFLLANHCGSDVSPLSNKAYNSLSQKVKKQLDRSMAPSPQSVSASHFPKGLNKRTSKILQRMINGQTLESVNGILRSGKEASIFHAISCHNNAQELAVKVFKLAGNEFTNRHEYLVGDHRFDGYLLSRLNQEKVVFIWAEKELQNLSRLHSAGIPAPTPVRLIDNVLVMTFIGTQGVCASQLSELRFSSRTVKKECFIQCMLILRALWFRCNLVHADFSEYNVLLMDRTCYVLDLGQAVDRSHPNAWQFLQRDVRSMLVFFVPRRQTVTDDLVDEVLLLISKGGREVAGEEESEEWVKYAQNSLGTWADARLAGNLASFLPLLF